MPQIKSLEQESNTLGLLTDTNTGNSPERLRRSGVVHRFIACDLRQSDRFATSGVSTFTQGETICGIRPSHAPRTDRERRDHRRTGLPLSRSTCCKRHHLPMMFGEGRFRWWSIGLGRPTYPPSGSSSFIFGNSSKCIGRHGQVRGGPYFESSFSSAIASRSASPTITSLSAFSLGVDHRIVGRKANLSSSAFGRSMASRASTRFTGSKFPTDESRESEPIAFVRRL
jgi:hypothetical protein